MNFEVQNALQKLGESTEAYFVKEALTDYDITMKRAASEALRDLDPGPGIRIFIAKIRLY